MKIVPIAILLLAFANPAQAGNDDAGDEAARVANFAANDRVEGKAFFEKLSFWSGPSGHSIEYVRGNDAKPIELHALIGATDGDSFAVRFPNGLVFDILIERNTLMMSDRSGTYRKRFTWHYEGPVDGRGTFCKVCVPEPLAIAFVRENFMQSGPAGRESKP